MELQLLEQIRTAQLRLRGFRRWTSIAVIGSISAFIILSIQWQAPPDGPADFGWLMALGTTVALLFAIFGGRHSYANLADVAREIEGRFPNLKQCLITAVDQVTSRPGRPRGYLQEAVIQQAVRHGRIYRWREVVPARRMLMARAAGCLSILIVGLMSANLIATGHRAVPTAPGVTEGTLGQAALEVQVEPGNADVERGTNVIVLARFTGLIPEQAALVVTNDAGQSRVLPMNRSLDDPLFGVHVAEISEDLSYRVEFVDQRSETYRLTVFEFPRLVQADAQMTFPNYTKLQSRTISDARRVTAVEGTELTWVCHVNKPLAEATLTSQDGQTIQLKPAPGKPGAYQAAIRLEDDQRWKVHFKDLDGRENTNPEELVAKVTPNRPPQIELAVAQDLRVSALEELDVGAKVWDDYGLNRYGIAFSIATQPLREVVLGEDSVGREEQQAVHMVDLESLDAEPNQLLSYYFWAEDVDSDDETRRVLSDMFFAEVRHFEEIFRQGQQPQGEQSSGGQGAGNQNTQQAEQLIDLQKQIISATWNIVRRESKEALSKQYGDDMSLVLESQESALQQLGELAQRVQDPKSVEIVEQARVSMQDVAEQLEKAIDSPSIDAARDALTPEQASYQGLLRLRAREFEVIRASQNSSSNSSASSSNRFQQQLQDLELEDDPQRYETQRQAQEQNEASEGQRETRQILSALRDLARRQADINKQLRELQTALELADAEEQREEIRRQLRRLRDQQEELLRDADELTDRLQQAQNQTQLEQTRQQLEQTRDRLQQSTQSLEEGDVSQALSSGTRAERELEQMRDELRQQAAEQFSEEMREIRQQARELDQQQQELSKQLGDLTESPQPGLRPSNDADEISRELVEQGEDLDQLLNRIEQTVVDAEDAEPLLTQKLYDAHRETEQSQTRQNLQVASELFENGLRDQARELETKAADAIQKLRENVEDAAESILGDEVEALRRASSELGELMRQIEAEFEVERGQESQQQQGQQQQGQQQQGQQQQGQQQQGQQQQGQQQQGQQQQGQQQQGQQQQGQQQQGQQQQGQQQQGQQQQGQQQGSQQQGSQPSDGQEGQRQQRRDGGGLLQSLNDSLGGGPLTGDEYRDWSDRLRDVEEVLDDPDLRSRAAQIRDRARGIRMDFKRHSREPQWPLVRELIAEPMRELRQRVTEELIRRSGDQQQLVPVDRDPVPDAFAERVRRYYEALGRGD